MHPIDFHAPFTLPFLAGAAVMAAVLLYKWTRWTIGLTATDRRLIVRGLFSRAAPGALVESVREALLHRRIYRINPLLGYMHMSLALGWFCLIVVGWIETSWALGWRMIPLQGHVFFRYFSTEPVSSATARGFAFAMDTLLAIVLSGVALAWWKRYRSRSLGLRRTTRHTAGDRVALTALWFVFPARLVAESVTSALYHNGGWLTASLGSAFSSTLPPAALEGLLPVAWWFYSGVLGLFLAALPFSRYTHIFTEVPLVFLRRCGLRSREEASAFDHFQTEACSRCGICIDPCTLQSEAGIEGVQSVYFLRDLRSHRLTADVADNCLLCGRCAVRCPVGIDLNTLRLSARHALHNTPGERRFDYLRTVDRSEGTGATGYFAGCMTLLTPRVLLAMERIFRAAGEEVWWADREGGICCGRPLKLAGETDSARRMMEANKALFVRHGIRLLVTSCPICLKVFREEYALEGIEVLHHTEYLARRMAEGRLAPTGDRGTFTYHDPCELGRGLGIYRAPREVLRAIGTLMEPAQTGADALCCGSSVANTAIGDEGQRRIASAVAGQLAATGAERIVTACPLCKKALARGADRPVVDIAEAVAEALS